MQPADKNWNLSSSLPLAILVLALAAGSWGVFGALVTLVSQTFGLTGTEFSLILLAPAAIGLPLVWVLYRWATHSARPGNVLLMVFLALIPLLAGLALATRFSHLLLVGAGLGVVPGCFAAGVVYLHRLTRIPCLALTTGLLALGVIAIVISIGRARRRGILTPIVTSTMTVTAMIFATILTASVFSLVFRGLGGDVRVEEILHAMPGGPQGALIFVMALIFILGFFLDFVEISVIVLPLVAPILILMGHDPLWLSILIAINLQTSFLTPPFGFSLFYLRAAAPKEITTGQIYRGVIPFIILQIVGMGVIWLLPSISTWLPGTIF